MNMHSGLRDEGLSVERKGIEAEQMRWPGMHAIATALEPVVNEIRERVFGEIAEAVRTVVQGEGIFEEAWIGIDDVSLRRGIRVRVVLCHKEGGSSYNPRRERAAIDLELRLAEAFQQIQLIRVDLAPHPYDQRKDDPPLPRLTHPELWKKVF